MPAGIAFECVELVSRPPAAAPGLCRTDPRGGRPGDGRGRRLHRARAARTRDRGGRSVPRPGRATAARRGADAAGLAHYEHRLPERRADAGALDRPRLSASSSASAAAAGVRRILVGAGRLRVRPHGDPLRHRRAGAGRSRANAASRCGGPPRSTTRRPSSRCSRTWCGQRAARQRALTCSRPRCYADARTR